MEQLWYTEYFLGPENSSEQNQVHCHYGFYILERETDHTQMVLNIYTHMYNSIIKMYNILWNI